MSDQNLAHIVFFTLKDSSDTAQTHMLGECRKYLAGHPGEVYFSVGTQVAELDRPVNDKEFHIALHVVFENKAAHDAYQVHERHLEFIEQNKDNWENVRVFDSFVE